MNFRPALCSLVLALVCSPARAQVAAGEILRLDATLPSPWGAPLGPAMPAGTKLRLAPGVMKGPAPLSCDGAEQIFIRAPANALFEGMLPSPAEQSAAALGLPEGLITQRIVCSNAGFDVHRAADGRAWIGLDNAVLRWTRVSIEDSPEATVQTLLLHHFSSNFAFSPSTVAAQATLLTESLTDSLNRWFVRAKTNDEVPALNGDPYTDSQEFPESFSLAKSRVNADRAELTVTYRSEGIEPYPVHVELMRVKGRWRVNDLRYRDGQKLSQLLASH